MLSSVFYIYAKAHVHTHTHETGERIEKEAKRDRKRQREGEILKASPRRSYLWGAGAGAGWTRMSKPRLFYREIPKRRNSKFLRQEQVQSIKKKVRLRLVDVRGQGWGWRQKHRWTDRNIDAGTWWGLGKENSNQSQELLYHPNKALSKYLTHRVGTQGSLTSRNSARVLWKENLQQSVLPKRKTNK